MLSNTVTAEAPIGNKEVPDSATLNFEAQADTSVQEKISVVHCIDEKPQLETVVKPEVFDTVPKEVPEVVVKAEIPDSVVNDEVPEDLLKTEVSDGVFTVENENVTDAEIDESAAIVIQAAARGFLVVSLSDLFKYKTQF